MAKLNHKTKVLSPKSVYENLRWAVEMAQDWSGYYGGNVDSEIWFAHNMECVRAALATLRHKNTKGPKSGRSTAAR